MAQTMNLAALSSHQVWSPELLEEFQVNQHNGCIGTALLSETNRVRIWTIRLGAGERIGFHRHVLDYFWTAVTAGVGKSHMQDGSTVEWRYHAGETRHESYGPGEYKVHDLENIGDTELVFTTVEFLDSANQPLPLPERILDAGRQPKGHQVNVAPPHGDAGRPA